MLQFKIFLEHLQYRYKVGDSGLSMFRIVNPLSWFDATSAYVEPSICTVSIWNGSVRCGYCTGSAIGDQVNITLITDGSDIANITGTILGDASFTNLVVQ